MLKPFFFVYGIIFFGTYMLLRYVGATSGRLYGTEVTFGGYYGIKEEEAEQA